MATVGYATLSIVPSIRGLAGELNRQLGAAARPARRAGEEIGDQVSGGAERGLGRLQRSVSDHSRRMATTFGRSTTAMGRGLSSFAAGFRDSDAAASAFTGRMGALGGAVARGLQPGALALSGFVSGFSDATAAASAFTGRAGTVGGAVRRGMQPAITAGQSLVAGFTDGQAAASALTGRLGTVGGIARRGLGPAITAGQNLAAGFVDSTAAASAFTGRMGAVGGLARSAVQPVVTAAQGIGTAMASAGGVATNALARIRTGAGTAFGAVRTGFTSLRANAAASAAAAGGVGSALTRMGAVGAAAVSAIGLGALGKSALGTAADIQQATASMAGLYGSTTLAEDMMRRLRDYSRSTPLETQSLYEAGSNLAYLGLEGESAMRVVENVGTALMASGNTSAGAMGNVTNALLSMQSAGQLYAADIQRVSNEMVPAWDLLAAHMGMSIKDVRAEVTAGKLTVDDFVDALSAGDGDYFAMMRDGADETNKTFRAQFAQVRDNVRMTLGETLLPLVDRAAPAMGRLGESIEGGLHALPGIMSSLAGALRGAGLVEGFRSLVQGARDFGAAAMPAITTFGQVVGGAFLGALQVMRPLGSLLSSMAGWMRENESVVRVLGAALGGAVVVMGAIRLATLSWAAAQAVLNAVLRANPVGLVITAVGALVAGIVYAYRNFEGFRNVVNSVWQTVRTAALWIWDNGLKPAFEGISSGLSWIGGLLSSAGGWFVSLGQAAMSLWTSYIQPAFQWIWGLLKNVLTGIIVVLILPAVAVLKIMGATAMWLWTNAIQPAFQAIGRLATWLWQNAIQPAFNAIGALAKWLWNNAIRPAFQAAQAGIRALGAVFQWLWANIVRPVFGWIANYIRNWWATARGIFNSVISFVRGPLGSIFRWFRDSVIRPVWNAISSTINTVWENGIRPAFNKVREGVRAMRTAFNNGRDAIQKAWNGIRDAAKKPVNFLIDTVYNKGILPLWNKVAGVVNADKLTEVSTFATGGSVYGAGTGTSDSIPALLSHGEHVWTAREVTAAGGHNAVEAIRARALSGGSTFRRGGRVGFPAEPNIPSGKRILDAVTSILSPSGIFGAVSDVFSGNWEGAIDRVLDPAKEITGSIGKTGLQGVPYQVVDKGGAKIKAKLKELIESWNSALSGGGGAAGWVGLASASERLQNAARWARTQHGLPYQWGGGGNPSWDCSGFMAGIERVIRGQRPGRMYTTHSFAGTPPAGWQRNLRSPFTVGVRHGGRGGGHMAGTLMGVNVESGGRGVQVGTGAQGTGNFPHKFGFRPVASDSVAGTSDDDVSAYDNGGLLKPGLQLVYNGTGKPETVRTAAQEARVERLVEALERGGTGNIINVQPPPATVSDLVNGVSYALRRSRRGGVHAGRM